MIKKNDIICLDLGSRAVKIATSSDSGINLYTYDTFLFFNNFGKPSKMGFVLDLVKLGLREDAIIRATGYGRNALNIANAEIIPEIQAHAKGAIKQTGLKEFTLLDLGGQDSKIVWVKNSRVIDFYMNDRCAASAGRFLENMANILGMSIEELSEHWEHPENLSSTCAVFSESELVAKLAKGVPRERLAAGVNAQILTKFSSRLSTRPMKILVLVGGVALNTAISKLLAIHYEIPIIIPEHPQHNAVIGLLGL